MTVFMTSDLHFGHENIIAYSGRPFKDVYHQTEELVRRWNEVVTDDDTVFVLGDVCMGVRQKQVPIIGRLNGQKKLVSGNHDYCHPMWADKETYPEYVELYSTYFEIMPTNMMYEGFRLCHFPYKREGETDIQGRTFGEWEIPDDGTPMLCGHVHEAWAHKRGSQGSVMVNVGVDQWNFTPTPFEVLKNYSESLDENI